MSEPSGLAGASSPGHSWSVEVGGQPHVVELGAVSDISGPPHRFTLDGTPLQIGAALGSGPWIADLSIAGRPARMTRRLFLPDANRQLGETATALARALPAVIAARAIGGGGMAGGVEGAVVADSMRSWMTYELSVAGESAGTWIVGGPFEPSSPWTWVAPGESWRPPAGAGPADRTYTAARQRFARVSLLGGIVLLVGGMATANPYGGLAQASWLAALVGLAWLIGVIVLAYWWRSHPG